MGSPATCRHLGVSYTSHIPLLVIVSHRDVIVIRLFRFKITTLRESLEARSISLAESQERDLLIGAICNRKDPLVVAKSIVEYRVDLSDQG